MNTNEIVQALLCENQSSADCKLCEYCKIISESNVWHCDEIKIKQEAADTIERLQKELEAANEDIRRVLRDEMDCCQICKFDGQCKPDIICHCSEAEWCGRESEVV